MVLHILTALDLPKLSYQRYVKPLFAHISTDRMRTFLEKLSGFYTRYFGSTTGEQSALFIHDQIADVSGLCIETSISWT